MRLPAINLSGTLRSLTKTLKANKTTVYAVGATLGVIGTGYTSAKATLETKEWVDKNPDATTKDKIQHIGQVWIAPVVAGGVTIFCIWRGHKLHLQKEASLGAIGAYYKKKYTDLEKKITEKLGEEESKQIKDEIAQENLQKKDLPATTQQDAMSGKFWIYDELSDQFMKVDGNRLTWAAYCVNEKFHKYEDVQYNWFLNLLGGVGRDYLKDCGWSMYAEELTDVMDFNGLGYNIDVQTDYTLRSAADNRLIHEGQTAAMLQFNYLPVVLYPDSYLIQ